MKQFTYQELGALLIAVGTVMARRDLCVQAATDGFSNGELIRVLSHHKIDSETAEVLVKLDLHQVIDYVAGYLTTGENIS